MYGPCVHCWQLQQTSGDVVAVEGVVMKRTPNSLVLRTPCAGEKKVAGGPGCQPLDDAEALRAWALPPKENRFPEQPGTGRNACPAAYAVNELPQPQLRAALGFWKTNPRRIRSSCHSSVVSWR